MKKTLRILAGAAVGAVVAIGFSSCAYDPYYSSVGVSTGYGDGYGYGNPGFSTSVFVSTGNPQWGYDPTCYSYYDYRRRCYYDPYLNGYYPIGYRPPIVYGVPHPYGWRAGAGYIRPPVRVTNVTVTNYRNRATLYQNTNYGWAKQVRQQPVSTGRVVGSHPPQGSGGSGMTRPNNGTHPSGSTYTRASQTKTTQTTQYSHQTTRPIPQKPSPSLYPGRGNTAVKSPAQGQQGPRVSGNYQPAQRPNSGRPQAPQNGKADQKQQDAAAKDKRVRGVH